MAEINSLDEHEALQYEILRRGYNKYGVRSDAYFLRPESLYFSTFETFLYFSTFETFYSQMHRFWLAETTSNEANICTYIGTDGK